MEGQSSDRNSRTVLFSACTSEESLRDCKRKSASLVQGRRTIMPIGGKHDAFDPDLPVSASLLLGNLATLQETYLHTVTNALLGLGLVPYAISGAVYSGTLLLTVLALTRVYELCGFASFFRQLPRCAFRLCRVCTRLEGDCENPSCQVFKSLHPSLPSQIPM
jgi:hypothetical protein